jgi:hypothetical protein
MLRLICLSASWGLKNIAVWQHRSFNEEDGESEKEIFHGYEFP